MMLKMILLLDSAGGGGFGGENDDDDDFKDDNDDYDDDVYTFHYVSHFVLFRTRWDLFVLTVALKLFRDLLQL